MCTEEEDRSYLKTTTIFKNKKKIISDVTDDDGHKLFFSKVLQCLVSVENGNRVFCVY